MITKETKGSLWRNSWVDGRQVMFLFVPVLLGSIISSLIQVTDGFFLAPLGETYLAAYALSANFSVIFYGAVYGFLSPLVAMLAAAFGRSNYQQIIDTIRVGIFSTFVLGVLIGIIFLASYFMLPLLRQPRELVDVIFPYWMILSGLFVCFSITFAMQQLFNVLNRPWVSTSLYFIVLLINLPVSFLLVRGVTIYGFTIPSLGLVGTGLASIIANIVVASLFFIYYFYHPSMKNYRAKRIDNKIVWLYDTLSGKAVNRKILGQLLRRVGGPIIAYYLQLVSYVSLGVMIGWLGVKALAARQISGSFLELMYMAPISLSYCSTIVVARFFGQRQWHRLQSTVLASFCVATLFGLMGVLCLLFAGPNIIRVMTNDSVVAKMAFDIFVVGMVAQFLNGFEYVLLGVLRGMDDFKFTSIVTIIGCTVFGLPAAYGVGIVIWQEPAAVMAGYNIATFLMVLLLVWRFLSRLKTLRHS
ncbi:MAG: MATE family efflux transporter [Alphaproteobacteria bacterium]|nr:MATE family efflux transporter [Alphaproteobacteria bacterium]